MTYKPELLLAAKLLLLGALPGIAAEAGAPSPPARIGGSEKICQLTGDIDWETGRPTAARTLTNFGLDGADLGYPVEHDGKLFLLFGDSWPPRHPGGPMGEVPPDDAVGITVRKEPPGADGKCLELQVNTEASRLRAFAPARIVGPAPVKQGFFNVPTGGVSAGGGLFAFFWTNHCSAPNPLRPSPDRPLVRPAANQNCPENDERNSIGRGVMTRTDDNGRTFSRVVPMPLGFVYSTAVEAGLAADVPEAQRLGIFIFGVPRYRAGIPYLAYAPVGSLADTATWQFFVGRDRSGQPKWVNRDEWQRSAGPAESGEPAAWKPPGEAELFVPDLPAGRCIGEFSITWNHPLGMWLMLYNCPAGGIAARGAVAPWGPWSLPTTILGADDKLGCRLIMIPEGCGNRRDFWPGKHVNGKFMSGGRYAPYVLNRYTVADAGDGAARTSTIFWLVSTWNPYEVVVMRTTLRSELRQ
jgi:hypothetical protein